MPQQRSWIVAAGGLAALLVAPVDGHIYVVESRQYYNSPVYKDDDFPNLEKNAGAYNAGGQNEVQKRARRLTDPDILEEYGNGYYPLRWVFDKGEMAPNGNYLEPQGISVRHGVCGDPKSGDQGGKDGENTYSTANKHWPVLQEFKKGQVMEVKAVMKAWHHGHLEFFMCNAADLEDPDGIPTQECFNKYPLTRAKGDGVNSPIDPIYPGRYYTDPPCREKETVQDYDSRAGGGYVMTMNYQLPEDLECEHCVLQMWYFTGHKCYHPGYKEFNPPSWGSECAPNKSDWIDLDIDYCGDNEWNLAEEFWACSDIAIKSDGTTTDPDNEEPKPTSAPTDNEEEQPTSAPTDAPTAAPSDDAGETKPTAAPGYSEEAKPTSAPANEPTAAPSDDAGEAKPTAAPAGNEEEKPTSAPADEPTAAPSDAGDGEEEKAVYVGCFHDNKDDRVLGDQLASSDMTTEMCRQHCTAQGAVFMATQFGFECWCSVDGGLDYERHYDDHGKYAVCDMFCQGDESERCGGYDSFSLYKLSTCSGTPVEAYEQCGGSDWTGSTCCSDGNTCTAMGDGCYSQCRPSAAEENTPPTPSPVDEGTTRSPVTDEPTTPSPVADETRSPVTDEPTSPATPSPVPDETTDAPVGDKTSDDSGCMVVKIEAEDLATSGDWSTVEDGDASGGKYITWLGMEPEQNNRAAEDGDIISTSIDIPTAGTYSFKWLMRQPNGVDNDKGNDAWLYFPDADRYGPADTNKNYGGFIKVYGRATKGAFEYSGTGEDSNGHTQIAIEFNEPGEYTMQISGRSHGLQLDQILVFGEDLSVDDAAANTGC